MPKQREIDYVGKLATDEITHLRDKPFSDAKCGQYLMDLGLLLSLVPAPPGRLLALGIGPGWTSLIFALRGYDVLGVDVAPAMIDLARAKQAGAERLQLLVADYESLTFHGEFDIAVFFDALHHAE